MSRKGYYALSFTWGIIMTLIGMTVGGILTMLGHKATKHGPCWCYVVGTGWGGVSLGPVIIMSEGNAKGTHTKNHEFGHSLQNCIWGPLFPFVIAIPSATRLKYREMQQKCGRPPKTEYDDIWFEGQATEWGNKYITKF